jgi:hypothetical protein
MRDTYTKNLTCFSCESVKKQAMEEMKNGGQDRTRTGK